MVDITFTNDAAVFEIEGFDKLWAIRSSLTIPLRHINGVRADPDVARGWWHGVRVGGTNMPGVITAGRFFEHGRLVFWDVHDPEGTIVIDLHDERYSQLIIEVADPAAAVAALSARIAGR